MISDFPVVRALILFISTADYVGTDWDSIVVVILPDYVHSQFCFSLLDNSLRAKTATTTIYGRVPTTHSRSPRCLILSRFARNEFSFNNDMRQPYEELLTRHIHTIQIPERGS